MDYSAEKESINLNEIISRGQAEQNIETEINLPDYCPDIKKILKCFVEGDIFACQISGDRATADGEARIRLIYTGEKGSVECYETSVPFSKYIQLDDSAGECCVSAVASTEYVNCRAVSQRRVSISSGISVRFCVSRIKTMPLITSAEGLGIQTRGEELDVDMLVGECCKMFELSETAVLDSGMPPVACLMKTDCSSLIDTVKCIANKILIKGEITLRILYRADSSENELVSYKHILPVSQIIEINGVDENSFCDVCIGVSSVSVTAKTDSAGENRLLAITVKALAKIKAYSEKKLKPVTDCYSTEFEISSESSDVELRRHIYTCRETKPVRQTVDISGVAEVKDIRCRKLDGSAENSGDKVKGGGSLVAGILYRNTDGEYDYAEKTLDFSFECQGKETDGRIEAVPSFEINELTASAAGNGKVEIRADISIYMPIYEIIGIKACTDIKVDEEHRKTEKIYPLTVYFSDKGEKLWDIARRYNTTVEAIQNENGISADETAEKMMLMIPAVG